MQVKIHAGQVTDPFGSVCSTLNGGILLSSCFLEGLITINTSFPYVYVSELS